METARKEAFIVHAVTSAEPAAGSSKRPEVVPYILDEEALERRRSRRIVWGRAAVAVLVFLVWEVFTRIGLLDSYYWSSPSAILRTTWTQMTEGTLLRDITYTSGSTILGFVFGTFLGALLGLSFWWSRSYAGISEPYLIILNAMPKLALAPVLVILLGIGFFPRWRWLSL